MNRFAMNNMMMHMPMCMCRCCCAQFCHAFSAEGIGVYGPLPAILLSPSRECMTHSLLFYFFRKELTYEYLSFY